MLTPFPLDYPLCLTPALHSRIWGGKRLASFFGRDLGGEERTGESWQVYDREDGSSLIGNGPLAGKTLADILTAAPDDLLGSGVKPTPGGHFPLLIKLLDAADQLSVQVHPGEEYARREEGDGGKPEAWVVLAAGPESKMVRGLRPGTSRREFAALAATPAVEEQLLEFPVQPGEVLWIPPGTVHALGKDLLVFEVQGNSDVTYRLYDWNRLGLDGKPRDLHLDKALAVVDFSGTGERTRLPISLAKGREQLVQCPLFTLERWRPEGPLPIAGYGSYRVITVVAGKLGLTGRIPVELAPGDTALLPAALGEIMVQPQAAACEFLVCGPGENGG